MRKTNMKTTASLSLCAALAMLLIGCTPLGHLREGRISRVNLGMTRQQVVKALGPPQAESLINGTNVLVYVEERPGWRQIRITVKLTDNHVTEYGNPAPR